MDNISEDMKKMEPVLIVGWNIKYFNHFGNSLAVP